MSVHQPPSRVVSHHYHYPHSQHQNLLTQAQPQPSHSYQYGQPQLQHSQPRTQPAVVSQYPSYHDHQRQSLYPQYNHATLPQHQIQQHQHSYHYQSQYPQGYQTYHQEKRRDHHYNQIQQHQPYSSSYQQQHLTRTSSYQDWPKQPSASHLQESYYLQHHQESARRHHDQQQQQQQQQICIPKSEQQHQQHLVSATPPPTPTYSTHLTVSNPETTNTSIPADHLPPTPSSFHSDYLLQSPPSSIDNNLSHDHDTYGNKPSEAETAADQPPLSESSGTKGGAEEDHSSETAADNCVPQQVAILEGEREKEEGGSAVIAASEERKLEVEEESRKEEEVEESLTYSVRKRRGEDIKRQRWRRGRGGESYGCERLDEELGDALNEMMAALGQGAKRSNSWNEVRNGDKNDDDKVQMVTEEKEEDESAMTVEDLSMQIKKQVLQNLQNMLMKRGRDSRTRRVKIKVSLEMEEDRTEETAYDGPVRLYDGENIAKEESIADPKNTFMYKCQSCSFSKHLTEFNLHSIAEHISVGFAPSISGLKRPPALFNHFLQRIKLSVNVAEKTASASTVVVCKSCGEGFNNATKAQKHFYYHHSHNNKQQLCLMCEKCVPDMEEHLAKHQSDHEQRFGSILSCGCKNEIKETVSVTCLACREVFHIDPSLPKWVKISLCRRCIEKSPLSAVVCSCCRRGGNGRRFAAQNAAEAAAQSVSVCLECLDLMDSSEFLARRGRKECQKYARGMLRQLMAQLENPPQTGTQQRSPQRESQPAAAASNSSSSSDGNNDNNNNSKAINNTASNRTNNNSNNACNRKVAVVPPEPRRVRKRKSSSATSEDEKEKNSKNSSNNNFEDKSSCKKINLITKATRKMIF